MGWRLQDALVSYLKTWIWLPLLLLSETNYEPSSRIRIPQSTNNLPYYLPVRIVNLAQILPSAPPIRSDCFPTLFVVRISSLNFNFQARFTQAIVFRSLPISDLDSEVWNHSSSAHHATQWIGPHLVCRFVLKMFKNIVRWVDST